jgi:hypothetical protein
MHGQTRSRGMAIKVSLDLLETTRSVGTGSGSKVRQQRPICILRTVYEDTVIRREGVAFAQMQMMRTSLRSKQVSF